ncbi:bifunctional proline dehydrogenase/L-glutamate gamma-semialdehyde dehydrogenase PutA [Candidatus Raskinella chloraquaticus]
MMPMSAFRTDYASPDEAIAVRLLREAGRDQAGEQQIDALATRLITAIRAKSGGLGGVEDVLREYSLSTKEGLALMVLAEALLRVPDAATADRLIEDKLGQGDFAHHEAKSDALLVSASAWALGLSARIIRPGETPDGIIAGLGRRLGLPTLREATRQAMRVLGSHFVLGETIEEALRRATGGTARSYRYSFDMLGEGARTAADARRYFASYEQAIAAIGRAAGNAPLPNRPGISVKLSALHPRYEAVSRQRVMAELVPQVVSLAQAAKSFDLNFTIDAEEADRLELSLDVIEAAASDSSLAGWDGFGLAIQAYQKRALEVIGWIDGLAQRLERRFMVRLVKGAYWDSEVKRAQERGLDDYPVFTRKAMTDLNYIAAAQALLAARPRLYPQFATHNALTIAAIMQAAGKPDGFEFQRLHGMGEAAYGALMSEVAGVACRTYAPVGGHRDLLAYLVRRLLENGANSSFVNVAADPDVPVASLLQRPAALIAAPARARHPKIALPMDLFGKERRNSRGVEFGHAKSLAGLLAEVQAGRAHVVAAPLIDGKAQSGPAAPVSSPVDGSTCGSVIDSDAEAVRLAADTAFVAQPHWGALPVDKRAQCLERAADLLEARRGALLALLQSEGGKTLDDALAEVREAVDFCRFYASEARRLFASPQMLPGPTGEDNRLYLKGRGVFVCISPWNFPLAIFLGQVTAALAAGNAVLAKPAEQTPLIAFLATQILLEAGIPANVLALLPGDGRVGAALVADPRIAGVAFTGSTDTARLINRQLAAKDGPIVPFIAETGGINAMIVDATALPEQVADDVVMSAFRSTGQRCSALRLLCVQEDVADKVITMVAGAAAELAIGDPRDPRIHIGPVIDAEARERLQSHIARLKHEAHTVFAGDLPKTETPGFFVAPHIFEISDVSDLKEEIFGPVLHVVRWKATRGTHGEPVGLKRLLAQIAGNGYGLTLGLQTRIDTNAALVEAGSPAGNLYINRNMIGAIVGSQPFGGRGLSGTGPKAGGPHYLVRFASEQVVSNNISAAGGNASLIAMGEE